MKKGFVFFTNGKIEKMKNFVEYPNGDIMFETESGIYKKCEVEFRRQFSDDITIVQKTTAFLKKCAVSSEFNDYQIEWAFKLVSDIINISILDVPDEIDTKKQLTFDDFVKEN